MRDLCVPHFYVNFPRPLKNIRRHKSFPIETPPFSLKNMQSTLHANSWMAAHLPGTKYMGVLCCAGSAGEAAFRNSLDGQFTEAGYQHLPATVPHPRPATYYVVGNVFGGWCAWR